MLEILDYKIKVRMPVSEPKELSNLACGFMCMCGSKAEDLVIRDNETGVETPFLEYNK